MPRTTLVIAILWISVKAQDCPCLVELPDELVASELYDATEGCLYFEDGGVRYCYDAAYGLGVCAAHDESLAPFCAGLFEADFCGREWCYVDTNDCAGEAVYESSYFPGFGLFYSYSTCNSINSFVSWFSDALPHGIADLVTLIESYAIATKSALETNYAQVVASLDQDDLKCATLVNACDGAGCEECVENVCWGGQEIDVYKSVASLSSVLEDAADPEDVAILKCVARFVAPTYLRTSAAEYDDQGRIAYQYFGSQATGALVQWPATAFCDDDYDVRPRPWYASAASGPKEVVIVVDVSGSMSGTRIALAREATKTVLGTLTWTDKVNVVLFNSQVVDVYDGAGLVDADEATLDAMRDWVDATVTAGGGTNFERPLQRSYDLLAASKSSSTCTQAVLFMTDGEAPLSNAVLANLVDDDPDVVVFTYKLGTGGNTDPLRRLACATNGLFYPVDDEPSLPAAMAEYYQYFVQLHDPCRVTWIAYTDAITDANLVAGCTAIFNPVTNDTTLLGVNCVDLNLVVSPAHLQTCDGDVYTTFLDILKDLAGQCGPNGNKITDPCVLARLRSRIHPDSVCASDPPLDDCTNNTNVALGAATCPVPSDSRFSDVPLTACDADFNDCAFTAAPTNAPTTTPAPVPPSTGGSASSSSGNGPTVAILVGILVGVLVLGIAAAAVGRTKRSWSATISQPGPPPPAAAAATSASGPPVAEVLSVSPNNNVQVLELAPAVPSAPPLNTL